MGCYTKGTAERFVCESRRARRRSRSFARRKGWCGERELALRNLDMSDSDEAGLNGYSLPRLALWPLSSIHEYLPLMKMFSLEISRVMGDVS